LESVKDPIIEQIKVLYELGESGQYEIIVRAIAVMQDMMEWLGVSSKDCVDRMMDKGVKSLELRIAVVMAVTRSNPSRLNGVDSSLRSKFLRENKDLIADFEKLEKQNE